MRSRLRLQGPLVRYLMRIQRRGALAVADMLNLAFDLPVMLYT
jgi:hypothetical protein